MQQWQIDWLRVYHPIGPGLITQLANSIVDYWTWWGLQMYYAKYRIPEQAGDFEKFVGSFSLNGICSRR